MVEKPELLFIESYHMTIRKYLLTYNIMHEIIFKRIWHDKIKNDYLKNYINMYSSEVLSFGTETKTKDFINLPVHDRYKATYNYFYRLHRRNFSSKIHRTYFNYEKIEKRYPLILERLHNFIDLFYSHIANSEFRDGILVI